MMTEGELLLDCLARLNRTGNVILHKLYWHTLTPSDRQLHDAAGVAAVQSGVLDTAYLRRWADRLSLRAILDDLLAGRIRVKTT